MQMKMKLVAIAALAMAAGVVSAQEVIKIGHVGPTSGGIAHLGKDNENGAKLAIEDGIAMRAARKNMQIHSAVILKLNGVFSGFMTFQRNHEIREFCLLQSVIKPAFYTDALYKEMVERVVAANSDGYPAFITTDPKSKFETPALFESIGFQTYLKMSGFHYMVLGALSDARMKLLAHITMTNVWMTTKGDWLRVKREWNERIDAAGAAQDIQNPSS